MRRLLLTAFATVLVSCGTTGTGLEGATTLSIGRRPILVGPVGPDRAVVNDLILAADPAPAAGPHPAPVAAPAPAVATAGGPATPPEPVTAGVTSTAGTWLASVFSLLAAPPPQPVAAAPTAAPAPPSRSYAPPPASLDDILACIRNHESNSNYRATNGIYRGAYQFDQSTWESVGGSGDPVDASASEQDHRAALLYAARGGQPWPNARC